jgi:hypothetical protein
MANNYGLFARDLTHQAVKISRLDIMEHFRYERISGSVQLRLGKHYIGQAAAAGERPISYAGDAVGNR